MKQSSDDKIIRKALKILESRTMYACGNQCFEDPDSAKEYFTLRLGDKEREVFGVIYLSQRNHLIKYEEPFKGDLSGSAVYPRVIAKRALELNSSAILVAHVHPSGLCEPSQADINITKRLKNAMELLSIRVLDHIIVAENCYSFAENGLM